MVVQQAMIKPISWFLHRPQTSGKLSSSAPSGLFFTTTGLGTKISEPNFPDQSEPFKHII